MTGVIQVNRILVCDLKLPQSAPTTDQRVNKSDGNCNKSHDWQEDWAPPSIHICFISETVNTWLLCAITFAFFMPVFQPDWMTAGLMNPRKLYLFLSHFPHQHLSAEVFLSFWVKNINDFFLTVIFVVSVEVFIVSSDSALRFTFLFHKTIHILFSTHTCCKYKTTE